METALAFSGGKDSWACLWLNENKIKDILVIWVNTGKNYPETLKMIEIAKGICPNFLEIKTDRALQNETEGIPSDVVPINWTTLGQDITGEKSFKIQSYLNCCYENISKHVQIAAVSYGVKYLIRGQRFDESHTSPSVNGSIVNGVEYVQPIESWGKDEVMAYLSTKMDIPDHFALNHTSMDCYDCTAYRVESKDRISYMEKKHPTFYAEYLSRMELVNFAINEELSYGE